MSMQHFISEHLVEQARKDRIAYRKQVAGAQYQAMLESAGRSLEFMSHTDPDIRVIALSTCIEHWRLGTECLPFVDACVAMAQYDACEGCSANAILCLAQLFAGTQSQCICELFAGISQDSKRSNPLRRLASLANQMATTGITMTLIQEMYAITNEPDADWRRNIE